MTPEERRVIFASSLGTVFEWYDFYLYGSLAVRPFGAIVFGRLGDLVGRKYTFLVTILIMGLSTFIVGLLPGYGAIGVAAPVILIALRLAQGLALGGEYGGAAIYVAEHARRASTAGAGVSRSFFRLSCSEFRSGSGSGSMNRRSSRA